MDARALLRRYLKQRREMGETELVLDRMTVDEALRILGAADPAPGSESDAAAAPHHEPADAPPPQAVARRPADEAPPADPEDWRAALRAADAGPPPRGAPNAPRPAPPVAAPSTGHKFPTGPAPPAPLDAGIVVGSAEGSLFSGPLGELSSVDEIAAAVASCRRCPLYATARHPVPGEGDHRAELVCVGEAPGATEDDTGRPFVGQAGQLLTKILAAINLRREDVFICNVLKHRPPENRNPRPEEIEACSPYLVRQLEVIRPKAVLALGTFAAQTLLRTKLPIGKLRGAEHRYYGVPLIVTYHPAALLRNPGWKRPTWEDVQLVRRILDRRA